MKAKREDEKKKGFHHSLSLLKGVPSASRDRFSLILRRFKPLARDRPGPSGNQPKIPSIFLEKEEGISTKIEGISAV